MLYKTVLFFVNVFLFWLVITVSGTTNIVPTLIVLVILAASEYTSGRADAE